jgi:hypothetical protein
MVPSEYYGGKGNTLFFYSKVATLVETSFASSWEVEIPLNENKTRSLNFNQSFILTGGDDDFSQSWATPFTWAQISRPTY